MTTEEPPSSGDPPKQRPSAPSKRAGPAFAEPEESADLSKEIAKTLPCGPSERVTCRRIAGNLYRCNWWSPQNTDGYDNPAMVGLVVTTHRVSRSELLHVTKTAQGLVIDKTRRGS